MNIEYDLMQLDRQKLKIEKLLEDVQRGESDPKVEPKYEQCFQYITIPPNFNEKFLELISCISDATQLSKSEFKTNLEKFKYNYKEIN